MCSHLKVGMVETAVTRRAKSGLFFLMSSVSNAALIGVVSGAAASSGRCTKLTVSPDACVAALIRSAYRCCTRFEINMEIMLTVLLSSSGGCQLARMPASLISRVHFAMSALT